MKEKNKEKRNVSTFLQVNVKKTLPNGLTKSFLRLLVSMKRKETLKNVSNGKRNPKQIVSQRSYRTQAPRSTPGPKKKRNVSKKFRRLLFKTYNFQNSNPSKHKLSRKDHQKNLTCISFILKISGICAKYAIYL
jgi:hypothetical protein